MVHTFNKNTTFAPMLKQFKKIRFNYNWLETIELQNDSFCLFENFVKIMIKHFVYFTTEVSEVLTYNFEILCCYSAATTFHFKSYSYKT